MNDEKLDRIIELLEEILKWTRFEGMQEVKNVLKIELDDDTKKIIYELSDGESSPKIAGMAKTAPQTVRRYWYKWSRMGLMEIHPSHKKRFRKVFSLEDCGMEVPETNKEKIIVLDENDERQKS
ncbi:MAG: hypothetical protein PHD13_01935 [Methanocellales archaeon]|nr:hypothetical protein [Methanocellales archaeon]MDD3291039.1 hypothetical protein [Methanocellales archaeon]MDD5234924.1 hypothetical protein [Methanocellales archaeon]MDD5484706.1 hypothetical protein [Methanocellales archaeon]